MFDHGTDEEDGPDTWEALASPRHIPVWRRAGDPSPTHDTLRAHVSSAKEAQNKRPQRGRLPARGTRAGADGGRESEHLRQDKLEIIEDEGILHEVKHFPCCLQEKYPCSCP